MSTKSKNKSPVKNRAPVAQADSLFQQAIGFHQNGQFAQAQAAYENVLKAQPRHFDALHLLGAIASQAGEHQKAVELMGRAIEIHPHNPSFYSNRGVSLQELGQLDAAVESYEHAIRLKPDYALAYFNRGVLLQRLRRFEAAVASYDHAIGIKPDYAEAHCSRGDALKELGQLDAAVASYDRAIELHPDYAEAYANRGLSLHVLKNFDAALGSYAHAIRLVPNYAQAHFNQGNVFKERNQFQSALESFDRAVAIKPDYAEAYLNRGAALKGLRQLEAAVASYRQAIAIKPDYAEAHYNAGVLLKDQNLLEAAIASYDRAIAIRPDYAEAQMNKALDLLLLGHFSEGWALYEWRWKNPANGLLQRHFAQPLWTGKESLQQKTILLHNEQGLGDAIQCCRYAKLLANLGARVVMEVPASLAGLLAQVTGVAQVVISGQALPPFDYHSPLLSLPMAFITDLQSIPHAQKYLSPNQLKRTHWAARLGPKSRPRAGLVWSGNPDHANDHNRSIALATLLPYLPAGIDYFSLQKELRDSDRAALASAQNLTHFGAELQDFDDTAALCDLMDVTICVDTSVAHLSGALGVATWILLPFSPDWRWLLARDDSPWYPSIKLYRQAAIDDWQSVLPGINDGLLKIIH